MYLTICHHQMQIKYQWDITTHLLKRPKSQTLTTPNYSKALEQHELSYIAGRNAKWYTSLEDSLVVS